MSIAYVYGLLDPETFEVRYVGHTRNSLASRVGYHWRARNTRQMKTSNPGLSSWLRSLESAPPIQLFETVPYADRLEAEKYYTDLVRRTGADLLNINSGAYLPPEHLARFLAAGHSPEAREKAGVNGRGWRHTAETKAKISAANTGRRHTPETRAKISATKRAQANLQGSV